MQTVNTHHEDMIVSRDVVIDFLLLLVNLICTHVRGSDCTDCPCCRIIPVISNCIVGCFLPSWTVGVPFQHDAQLDYYSKRLATCSSDRKVKVFDVSGAEQVLVAELPG